MTNQGEVTTRVSDSERFDDLVKRYIDLDRQITGSKAAEKRNVRSKQHTVQRMSELIVVETQEPQIEDDPTV